MSHRVRIAVTGLGLITPAGLQREATWKTILAGSPTASWLSSSELGYPQLSGQPSWYGSRVDLPHTTSFRLEEFALRAAREAVSHAGLKASVLYKSGVVIGTSKSDLHAIDETWETSPNFLSQLYPSNPARVVANEFGCQGAALCPVAACATGLVSLIRAVGLIREGVCNVALAGSADASLHPGLLSSYRRLGVLASAERNPATACKPFDQNRNGFVVGEGAAVLVLENWEHALQRGAMPLAEWIDGAIASDPTGLTSVDDTGKTLADLMNKLLERNSLTAHEINAVSVHGTATMMNDLAESRALKLVFGDKFEHMSCFGIKGAIGHLMGAAGAVESGLCMLSLRDQIVPPTANHVVSDPECSMPLHTVATPRDLQTILKISLGFGGHLAAGLFCKVATASEKRVVSFQSAS